MKGKELKMTERKFTPPTEFPAEYVTTCGKKITLVAKSHGETPFVGHDEAGIWYTFRESGYSTGMPLLDLHDLPQTKIEWMNDYGYANGSWHCSREKADIHSGDKRIAVIRREWTEGQPPKYFTEEAN